jgi:hypothetical protein
LAFFWRLAYTFLRLTDKNPLGDTHFHWHINLKLATHSDLKTKKTINTDGYYLKKRFLPIVFTKAVHNPSKAWPPGVHWTDCGVPR